LKYSYLVDCEWNDWETGECSKTCGGGSRTNSRTKETEEAFGGVCEGDPSMEEECNVQACRKFFFKLLTHEFEKYPYMILVLFILTKLHI
jgi:hypothetical protein